MLQKTSCKLTSGFICWENLKTQKISHTFPRARIKLTFCFNPFQFSTSHTHTFSSDEKERWSSERFVSEMKSFWMFTLRTSLIIENWKLRARESLQAGQIFREMD